MDKCSTCTAGCVCRFVWASVLVDQGARWAETGDQGGDLPVCRKGRRREREEDARGCDRKESQDVK